MVYAEYADIPLSQLENPKTAESALETLGRSTEQLALEHNLQGLLTNLLQMIAHQLHFAFLFQVLFQFM